MTHALSLVAMLALPCMAVAEPSYFRVTGVAADDTLNVRRGPSAEAEDIGDLPFDARRIEVFDFDDSGAWARIALNETDGWIATQFLEADPVPTFGQSLVPVDIVCGGTEPFWALGLYQDYARFSHPEDGDFDLTLSEIQVAQGRLGTPTLLSLSVPDGGADVVIDAAMCSDGMSDRSYGWTVYLKIAAMGRDRFVSGCCHLPRK